ncbi:class I SAM-dependent methyltransferase [Hellea balneolensis]|uniref:class I SAM-dependent methyltransferase n=1 Tax=Hellea balneolensis TaxID=287478 RepID=UPI0003F7460F|nr:class I SAM-dependent methyltransferase [Hellea balneolensis]
MSDTLTQSRELSELYKIRFSEEELPRKNAIWKVLCEDFFSKYISENDVVLDVACGYGEFSNNIKSKRKITVDLNMDAKAYLNSDVEFNYCSATELSRVCNNEIDRAFTSNFLEHLPDKDALDTVIGEVFSALKPGGKFIIMGPNLRYLAGEYWDFYDHHLGLTHLSLGEALRLKGFEIEMSIDKFLPYTTQGALPTHPLLVKIYLKVPLIWKLLGKQFFIVAQKPLT